MASRIPPLLDTYLRLPPEASLVLLSGVLGSTTNWLVLRYLHSLFTNPSDFVAGQDDVDAHKVDGPNVVLVSFLRDYAFWKEGSGKLGVDLDLQTRKGRFIFIDGLVSLIHTQQVHATKYTPETPSAKKVLFSTTPQCLYKELEDAVAQVRRSCSERNTVLIVDQLDMFLATSGGKVSGQELREILLDIREKVHSCIVTVSADEPLISSQTTSLEKEHAALAISLAHDANLIISLRLLETGTARDVSGVLRATPGGGSGDVGGAMEERELLYFVTGDGGVRVFERGQ
ncbi:hypothetical protein F5B19DRAFT_75934 [Rostrohypoxylon terebratum]|nr:hypothetical protein F5B19DRAFT_75934 [Rostrohypoxylon terebratum]